MSERRVARVQLESPVPQLDRLFDYAIPHPLVADVAPGVRVKVPLRSAGRMMEAFVVEVVADDGTERPLSSVEAVVSTTPVLPARLYTLARRVADRAAGSVSDILRLAVPKRMVRAEKAWAAAPAPATPDVVPAARDHADSVLGAYPGLGAALDAGERLAVDAPPHPHPELPRGAWADLLAAAATRTLARGRSAVLIVPDYRDQAQLLAALAELVRRRRSSATTPTSRVPRATGSICAPSPPSRASSSDVARRCTPPRTTRAWSRCGTTAIPARRTALAGRARARRRPRATGARALGARVRRTHAHRRSRLVDVGYVREVPQARRPSPRVVLSATREGEQRQSRVPSSAFAAAREALQHGPVLVQVARPGYAPSLVCADCRRPARCPHCAGPLRAARPGATPVCAWCGRSAHAWSCGHCGSVKLRMASSGSERTADELGRAFPNTRVIVADGAHQVAEVDAAPALVIATRGAEPLARGGYRAVILLDGDRMLQNEALRIGEHCLRWWSNAAALAAPGAPVHLVGVAGPVARALATWTQPAYARAELADRAPLRMPPAVRVASVDGHARSVDTLLASLRETVPDLDALAVLGPVDTSTDPDTATARALVRFDYAHGRAVAEALRAGVIADALRARKSRKDRGPRPRSTLRVRLDIPEPDL